MKTRIEAVEFTKALMESWNNLDYIKSHIPDFVDKTAHHIGYIELRALLDFIYESKPVFGAEFLRKPSEYID